MTHPVWHWEIAVYLFLGGLTAGIMILGAIAGRHERASKAMRLLPLLAPIALSAGMLALFLDLGSKLNVFRFYTTFRIASPMSWGAWILVAVYPASIALGLARIGILRMDRRRLEIANVILGIALGAYTGVLLAATGARALWSTRLLAPLFLISGVSTAAALTMLLPITSEEHRKVRRLDVIAIGVELALLALYLSEPAAAVLRGGSYTAMFWSFVMFAGLTVPLTIELIECRRRLHATVAAPLLILGGGLALRWILVAAGQAA
jgi:formate-dependent nitrite reductase membrane component NrfD